MEVKISFDTEKESMEDLRRLIAALEDLIAKRERAVALGNPLASMSVTRPAQVKMEQQVQQQTPQQQAPPSGGKTAGGGRVIEYQDLSSLMVKVFSGK